MLYEDYLVEDFLLDASFQKYCLGSDDDAVRFWSEWITAHPQKKEEVEQAKELYFILNGNNTSDQFARHKEKFSKGIASLINSSDDRTPDRAANNKGIVRKLIPGKIIAISAAASVIIIVGIALLTYNIHRKSPSSPTQNIVSSGQSEHKVIQLPDGSKVILNARSTVQIDAGFNNRSRELSLSGEAFFDVAHDASKPFIIHTQYVDVKVLGTIFNVKAYPDQKFAETSLLRGSVELTLKKAHNKKIILKPNEKISIEYAAEDNARSEPTVIKTNIAISKAHAATSSNIKEDSGMAELIWNKGNLVFDNTSFEDIAIQLQQGFGVTISFKDGATKQYRFTGDFSEKTVTQILNALQLSRSFNYEIRDSTQIIISK